ncbi:uncharacterized protein LOC132638770 [Lycium barbarum]|uniref:uncharacterized protein LOC132638770 n=1 Tax=Lycium barbarum TaxID=112863 RepID=UPI00293ECDB9|nr:uncharacterized protein LOC132638770 [Lycium barbarum]
MDVKNWYRSFSTRSRSIRLGSKHHDDIEGVNESFPKRSRSIRLGSKDQDDIEGVKESFPKSGGSKRSIWKNLWKKWSKEKKEKKKSRLESSRSVHVQVPCYDEYTYSQNFDKGFSLDEPDHLFKSFSVRYADPSKLLLK